MNIVEPIRDPEKIKEIKKYLRSNEIPRNYLLFVLGINFALRACDLLGLKVKDVCKSDGSIRQKVHLREGKTNKEKTIRMNDSARNALNYYFDHVDAKQADWLFPSRTHCTHINRTWGWKLVNRWVRKVGLEGNYGMHSLRKTFGFQARQQGVPIELIQAKFNHSTPAVTRRYIGITAQEVGEIEENVNI